MSSQRHRGNSSMCRMSSSPHLCMCTLAQVLLQAPTGPERRDLANGLIASYTSNVLGKGKVIWVAIRAAPNIFPCRILRNTGTA